MISRRECTSAPRGVSGENLGQSKDELYTPSQDCEYEIPNFLGIPGGSAREVLGFHTHLIRDPAPYFGVSLGEALGAITEPERASLRQSGVKSLQQSIADFLWDISTPDGGDRRFRRNMFARLPDKFLWPVAKRYRTQFESEGLAAANQLLWKIVDAFSGSAWRIASSDEELRIWASRRADEVARLAAKVGKARAYQVCAEFCRHLGIPPPEPNGKNITETTAVARMICQKWWRRQVRKVHGRRIEAVAIKLGLVNRRGELYASNETVQRRKEQKTRNREMLEACIALNELDQQYTLAELVALSVSNPDIRRSELMTRMAGFEQYAERYGYIGEFYTWTCPSRMHSHLSVSGDPNPRFDGSTPREANAYLRRQWAKARAAFQRAGIRVNGFRVCEPHHDGTPHWHLLLFMEPRHRDNVRAILKRYALELDGDEPGADKHRFSVVEIDRNKGTATGYIAKYIAKNIDAFGVGDVDEDENGKRDPKECTQRVDAWASCWGIRQFQQIGGPPVTVWRELRRVPNEQPEPLEAARFSADKGNWCGYIEAMGGPNIGRAEYTVKLAKIWSDKPGRYGIIGMKVIGVTCGSIVVVTRVHEWRIENYRQSEKDYFQASADSCASTKCEAVLMPENGSSRDQRPEVVERRLKITAEILPYGSQVTGLPIGTILEWDQAKKLPPGDEHNRVARWIVS